MAYAALIQQILGGIQAAINAWPQVQGIIDSGKALFTALFQAGKISAADQNALHTYIDGLALMAQQGLIPPELVVDPDPVSPAPATPAAPAAPVNTAATPAK